MIKEMICQLGVLTKIIKKILFVTLAVIMLGCIEILPKPTESGKNTPVSPHL
jgi:hypothetical protein